MPPPLARTASHRPCFEINKHLATPNKSYGFYVDKVPYFKNQFIFFVFVSEPSIYFCLFVTGTKINIFLFARKLNAALSYIRF